MDASRTRDAACVAAALLFPIAAAAADLEETVPVVPGGRLRIELDHGSVEVRSHDAHEVEIAAHARGWRSDDFEFELARDGNDVVLRGRCDRWLPFGGPRVRVEARVPRRFSVEVDTSGGAIAIEAIGGEVVARTSGGTIQIRRVRGEVEVDSSGGRLELAEIEGPLRARTSGGTVVIERAAGPVDARTSGGRVFAELVGEVSGRLETSGGSIEVVVPRGTGLTLDAATSGGRVEVEAPHASRDFRDRNAFAGDVNGGGPELVLRTSGGQILLRETGAHRAELPAEEEEPSPLRR
jgi:hypothetical protein